MTGVAISDEHDTFRALTTKEMEMDLKDWMEEEGVSSYALAKMCGVAQSVAFRWMKKETRPDWSNVPAITKATGGKVTAMDFVPKEDA